MENRRFTFTRAKLSALPLPPAGWTYYHDAAMRGLTLGVSASGVKSFRVLRKFQGRTVRVTLGAFDDTVPEAHGLDDDKKATYLGQLRPPQREKGPPACAGRHAPLG